MAGPVRVGGRAQHLADGGVAVRASGEVVEVGGGEEGDEDVEGADDDG